MGDYMNTIKEELIDLKKEVLEKSNNGEKVE